MPDVGVVAVPEYSDLIKEVYIDPIRTVVVIDDEFPSLDGLIARELGHKDPWNGSPKDLETVNNILNFSRNKEKPWLVDVHDGKKVNVDQDEHLAPYLQHSDLIILDYHLEGNDGTGDKAIKILRKLAANDHFNMVVVYTKGYGEPGGEIERVVREIALGLTSSNPALRPDDPVVERILAGFAEWEQQNDSIADDLKALVSAESYLSLQGAVRLQNAHPDYPGLEEVYKSRPQTCEIELEELIQWVLWKKEEELADQLSPIFLGAVTMSSPGADIKWVRNDRLFITVVSKNNSPEQIPQLLLSALGKWSPRPHRLLLAKMRALIDARGVVAEANVLSNHYIQAGWLLDLLNCNEDEMLETIKETIHRHWEALGDALISDIQAFGKKLSDYLTAQDRDALLKLHSPVDHRAEADNIAKALNCYVSTKPVDGSHLTTGHILEIPNGDAREYWVCLSPACDLVPGQKTTGWFGRLGNYVPFIAVMLSETKDKTALSGAEQNIFVFFNIEDSIQSFSFNPNGDLKANPRWEQMFGLNKGAFVGAEKTVTIARLRGDAGDMTIRIANVKVVSQLRYEYALNLLQRLGTSLSRIGLDFRRP